ncbi:helix-turn-helix domain-containing protein [Micromonospora sp. NPDC048999]|uniref:winged helix-turn-helix transcriptional regulator n=1 Tax=Micromonospora sp. NPDC048999 TaxID=3155391 RepID=UPI0033FF0D91
MQNRLYAGQSCSIARALDVVGERWSLLIVREALLGATRFDEFLRNLGIARNVLADRLGTLVHGGVLQRVPYQERPLRHEYHLTDRGRELVPVVLALMQWGDRHFAGPAGPPRLAEHDGCGGAARSGVHCVECDRELTPTEVTTRFNPVYVPKR